jgi:hypothetical protein
MKRVCVVDVYTSTYRYVPVCTSMYWRYLNFEFLEIRPHPSISLALELYAVAVYSRRAALVYEKHSCLVSCIYLYLLVHTIQGILYWHVQVCTGMYRYVQVHMILPYPVQVYRIPDGTWSILYFFPCRQGHMLYYAFKLDRYHMMLKHHKIVPIMIYEK